MVKAALLIAALLGLSVVAEAQQVGFGFAIDNMRAGGGGGGGAYAGPGDIVSGATAWFGLRAYSAATKGNNAVVVTRASDSVTAIVKTVTATGYLDIASANAFAGTAATCTGTIAGTTLSVSSCSGALALYNTLTGAGIVQPSFITSIGTCATPPGTCTLNATQTVSVAETITAQIGLYITTWYDQSGSLFCGGAACNATVATGAAALLLPACPNSQPCAFWPSGRAASPLTPSANWPNMPFTTSAVAERLTNTGIYGTLDGIVSAANTVRGFNNVANSVMMDSVTASAADGVLHTFQFIENSASSVINVDGTQTGGSQGGFTAGSGTRYIGQSQAGNQFGAGYLNEIGFWSSAFASAGNPMCNNQRLFYGTAGSC